MCHEYVLKNLKKTVSSTYLNGKMYIITMCVNIKLSLVYIKVNDVFEVIASMTTVVYFPLNVFNQL